MKKTEKKVRERELEERQGNGEGEAAEPEGKDGGGRRRGLGGNKQESWLRRGEKYETMLAGGGEIGRQKS